MQGINKKKNYCKLEALQGLPSQCFDMDWSEVKADTDLCVQPARRAVSHLIKSFQAELQILTETGWWFFLD